MANPFKMKHTNSAFPFKSSPLKGDFHEVLDHWKKYAQNIKSATKQVVSKAKPVVKSVLKGASKKLPIINIASMLMGHSASADQPGPEGKSVMGTYNPKTETYE